MYTPYPASAMAIRSNAVDRSFMCPPFSGIHPRLAAECAAEALDGCGGGRSGIDEGRINRALDVCPRAAPRAGHALEDTCSLALLRLQDAQVSARVLAQFANPRARVGLELMLRFAQAPLDLTD